MERIHSWKQFIIIEMSEDKTLIKWQIANYIFVLLTGMLFHFMFEFFGENIYIAFLFPVNESLWEHMKLFYLPMVIFLVIEYIKIGKKYSSFLWAKVFSIVFSSVAAISIYMFFYSIFGEVPIFSIISFIVPLSISIYIETKIILKIKISRNKYIIPTIIIFGIGILFVVFTYFPPEQYLFVDFYTEQYGIIN